MNKVFFKIKFAIILIFLICFFAGCGPEKKEKPLKLRSLKKLSISSYPEFKDDLSYANLAHSIEKSLIYYNKIPGTRKFNFGEDIYTADHIKKSLEDFLYFISKRPSVDDLNEFIKKEYSVYQTAGNEDKQTLFTGYYEPTYKGSLKKEDIYTYPIYSEPDDLLYVDLSLFSKKYKGHQKLIAMVDDKKNKVIPYHSRENINAIKDFSNRAEPVAWLSSRIDRFFLEVQGSGRIDLDNGDQLRVHYAQSNGNAYSSIGRYLIKKNEIAKKDMSMQAIRKWLEQNPQRMDEVLHHNKSFVFFRQETGGPYGSIGVEITPFRTIATDRSLFPKGSLCFLKSYMPQKHVFQKSGEQHTDDWQEFSGFVLNQDTGGAIKGPARADIFCGNGDFAEFTAGHMNKYGFLYFLVLNKK